jgi:hypothetical protein
MILAVVFGVVVLGAGVFILTRSDGNTTQNTSQAPSSSSEIATNTSSESPEATAEPDFKGVDSCAVLSSAIASVYSDRSVSNLEARSNDPVFQGGRYWESYCQYDDTTDPAAFSSNIDIRTFATEKEATDTLVREKPSTQENESSVVADSSYSPGAFTISTDQYGVVTRQLSYVKGTSRVQLVVGGEAGIVTKIEALADSINSQL